MVNGHIVSLVWSTNHNAILHSINQWELLICICVSFLAQNKWNNEMRLFRVIKMLFLHTLHTDCIASLMQQFLSTALFSSNVHRFNFSNTKYFFRNMRKLSRNLRYFHSRKSIQNVNDVPRYWYVFLIATLNMDALLFISTLYVNVETVESGAVRKTTCFSRAFIVGYGKTLIA